MNLTLTANGKFYIFDLARALQALGVQADVFSSYPRFKLRDENLPQSKIHTFPWLHAPYMAFRHRDALGVRALWQWEWEAKRWFDRHVARRLPKELDVLVGMSGSSLESGRAAQARGARYVCDRASAHIRVQDRILREEFDRWQLPFPGIDPRVIEREEAEYAQADAIAVPSSFVVRSFAEQGVPAHKVHRLPLGVDLSRYRATAAPEPGRFDVLFVAAFSLQKGVPYLLEAYKRLQHPNKSLAFAGARAPELVEHLKRLGLWVEEAQVLGHLSRTELVDRMGRSHVMVLPSVQEGLAMVQAQAMACGCPVIGTTHSGAEELFDDGVEGFVVKARDADAIAERLQWMADHPDERAAMGRLALERVRSLGGWGDYGRLALSLYRRLAAAPTPASGDLAPGVPRMKILYLGDFDPRQTSRHVGEALQRLGHTLEVREPFAELGMKGQSRWLGALHYRSGYRLLQSRALRWARGLDLAAIRPDVIWIDSGELFGRGVLRALKRSGAPVVLRSNDDPTGPRDARRFATLRRALPEYDLVAVHARELVTEAEYRRFGVRRVLPIVVGYDEIHHRPFDDRDAIDPKLRSQVAFVGTWIPGDARDDFVCRLLELGVPVAVWGNNWHKAPRWAEVKPVWRGPALSGRDYVAALQGAQLMLGLLSHGNRDGHTQRSNEVPYAGGLLCAERSGEHLAMFRDGEEAVFWTDADDCAALCKRLLADDALRERIRAAGMRRVRANRVGNEDVARLILDTLADADGASPARSPFAAVLQAAQTAQMAR